VDDDLRELERAVAKKGDAPSRLRLARALERAGRRDEVYALLKPAVADAEVRKALLELPAWRYHGGTPGNTRVVDLAPLRREPVVRALASTERVDRVALSLLATEAVLILEERRTHEPRRTVRRLDAATGAERGTEHFDGGHLAIERSCLVLGEDDVRDLWTGEATTLRDRALPWRRPGDFHRLWASASWMVGDDSDEVIALDHQERVLWRRPLREHEVMGVDEAGAIVRSFRERGFLHLDREGRTTWTFREEAVPVALGASWVIAVRMDEWRLALHDRRTGARYVTFPWSVDQAPWEQFAVARDVIYSVDRHEAVVAATLSGDELWRVPFDKRVVAIAPGPRCVYAATIYGAIYRLSDE
jgi:hypothetical protein